MTVSDAVILIPAQAIEASSPCLFWPGEPDESLAFSLARLGQMEPVLVERQGEGFSLVAGARRLAVLTDLGRPVLAREVEATDLEKGLLYLSTNAARPLTDGMRFAALRYFHMLLTESELTNFVAPLMGLSPQGRDIRLLLAWFNLPDAFDPALMSGRLPLAAGEPLSRMTREEQEAVLPFFATLAWSRGSAVNFLTWILEAARAREMSASEILAQGGFYPILSEEGLSPKDAITALTALARAARYPALFRLETEAVRLGREICAGTAFRLTRPDQFETPAVELTVRVAGPGPLSRATADFQKIAASPLWDRLFNLAEAPAEPEA